MSDVCQTYTYQLCCICLIKSDIYTSYGIVYQKPRREAEKIKYKIFRQFVINYEKNSIFDFVKKLKRDNIIILIMSKK